MAVLAVISLVGLAVDPRMLGGAPVWIKPLKFCLSGALYVLTLGVLLRPLGNPRFAAGVSWVVGFVITAETVLIAAQAARGVQSHFNVATPTEALIFSTMGILIGVLWVATLVAAVAVLRTPSADRLWKQATLWGLAIALAGGAVGAVMTVPSEADIAALSAGTTSTAGAHAVGVPDGGPGLPVLGWSTQGGDLRVPHFWGLHGLQAVPLLALLLVRFPSLSDQIRRRLLAIGGVLYSGLFGVLLQQAFRAQPFVRPDSLTLWLTVGLFIVSSAATILVIRGGAAAMQSAV